MWKPEYRSAAERDGCATAIKATYALVALDLRANGMQITCPLPLLILTPLRTRGVAGLGKTEYLSSPRILKRAPLSSAGDRATRRKRLQGSTLFNKSTGDGRPRQPGKDPFRGTDSRNTRRGRKIAVSLTRSRRGPAKRKGQHACHGDCVPELIDDLRSRGQTADAIQLTDNARKGGRSGRTDPTQYEPARDAGA
jgi:hypothetical protein